MADRWYAKPIVRECFVMMAFIIHSMGVGFILGYPAVMTPALVSNTTDVHATIDEASWIAAANGISGVIGFFLFPPMMQMYGRRLVNIILNIVFLLGWVIVFFAQDVPTLIAARIIQGIGHGGMYINSICVAEYAHPSRRALFIAVKQLGFNVGSLICHGVGFVLNWRQVAVVASAPFVLAIFVLLFFKESPAWLAYKGRYKECAQAFEWLRGTDEKSHIEVEVLIAAQIEERRLNTERKKEGRFRNLLKLIRSKGFMKSLKIAVVISLWIEAAGLHYYSAYIVQMLKDVTQDQDRTMYFTLIFDVMSIISLVTSSCVIKFLKRRRLLIISTIIMLAFTVSFCVTSYLETIGLLDVWWLPSSLLICSNAVVRFGILPVLFVVSGEIMPLEIKGTISCIAGVILCILGMVFLKLTPFMIEKLRTYGTVIFYTVVQVICLNYVFFALPETKDRTLQDIEDEIKDIKRNSHEQLVNTVKMLNDEIVNDR